MDQRQSEVKTHERFRSGAHTADVKPGNPPLQPPGVLPGYDPALRHAGLLYQVGVTFKDGILFQDVNLVESGLGGIQGGATSAEPSKAAPADSVLERARKAQQEAKA
jgi:hypothetical protein